MADWWEDYKKRKGLSSGGSGSQSGRTYAERVTTDEHRQAAKSSTWWEDYKKKNDLERKAASDRQRAAQSASRLKYRTERNQQIESANRQLEQNRSRDAAEDRIRELTRNPFGSDAEWQAGVLQRNAERYKRDLPLYQQAMQNSSTWGEYFGAHRQAGEAQSAVKHQFERYQQAAQKAEQERNESNLVNRPAQWQAENLTPQEIEQRLAYYRSEAATPTVTDKDREARAYLYPEAALQKDPHGARFDERLVEDAGQDAIDAAYRPILTEQEQAAVEEADRQIIEEKAERNYEQVQRLLAAQAGQTETASRARGNELIEEIAQGGEAANRAKTGKALFEQQQKKIDEESPTIIYGARGNYSSAMAERTKRGYILGSDWDNVPEDRKQAVYALYTESPEKAIELAKFYIADAQQAEDEERQAWYAQSGWTAALGLASSAAAHLGSAVDPFGPVGQELTRYGDSALAGGSRWADAATDYQKIPEWVPIVGGKGAGDLYQTVGSVVQSAAVAAPAILAGRYDKAAAETIGKLGLALMGSSAAASDYRESVAAGMDENRAKLHALAAGVEEALFEEVSLDKLIKMDTSGGLKSALKNWLVQSGVEGSEELATSIANRITDELISGAGQSKVERRASELIANGMSATQAKQQAESEWMKDTLYEGFSGFLSGGMMTGGNYALQGAANLAERAVNAAETRKAKKQAGAAVSRSEGSVEALQAYARDKGIEIKGVETAEQNAEQGEQGNNQNSYSARDYRSISETNSKVTQAIRSDLRGKTVQEQQTIRDSLVEKYGEGIAPAVYNAISLETASRVRQEYGDVDSIQAARNRAVSEIKDESLRRAVSDGYDSAAYALAANQGGESGMNTMSRYIQQRRNTGSGSEMSMNATVTAQDGSTKTIAITGMSEDGKHVSLADGSEVAVKDLQADADTTSAIQQLADLDLEADATKVLQAYQQSGITGTDGYRWLMDYATAYNQGRTRQISLEQAAQRSSLDERTVMDAYTLGQQAANRETQAGLEKLKNLPKRKGASGRTANIDTTEIKGKTMSKSELEQFELANQYAKALGVDMKWFSSKEQDGKFVGKNGAYENGKIYMDIHAGRNFAADLTSGILATMGHELSHFEQQYAPEEYQALKQFLFEQIVKSSPNGEARLERLIWEKQRRSGNTLSRKAAEDEVVADACQKMLRDSKAVHDFASQHPEAANGVVRWLDKWFKRVRSIFGRGGNYSEEAQIMDSLEQDVKAAFGELWDKALKQAAKVHDEVGNIEKPATESETKEESKAQNSDRDAEYLDLAKDPEKNAARLQEMVDEAAKRAGYTIKAYHGTNEQFTVFSRRAIGKNAGTAWGPGFYFTDRFEGGYEESAREYGGVVVNAYLKLSRPLTFDQKTISRDKFVQTMHEYESNRGRWAKYEFEHVYDDSKSDAELFTAFDGRSMSQYRMTNDDVIDAFKSMGFDGLTGKFGNANHIIVFDSDQIKSADPVTYDDSGNVVPLSERFNTENQDIRYSERDELASDNQIHDITNRSGITLDSQSESAAPMDGLLYSERTWSESRFVRDRENAAKALAKALNVSVRKAEQYIDDINSVAKVIADDRARLDYLSSPGRSAFKSNAEYGGSIDFSTLCKKRQLLTGTFNAIQHALANTVLTVEDVLRVRQMMQDAGLEVNCGMCYVEGSRARMGEYNKTFLELYKKYFPDNWQPKMEDVNTTDGLELMRMEHPECYEQYEHFYNNHGTLRSEDKAIFSSQAKPKEYQLRTEYKGEIKEKFQKDSTVETKNLNGGLRMQSFSDFEIVHLIDCMQVIMDMSEVGLAGQAYTKVPEFAEALGRTGLKINLSLVAKGVDENGKLIFNDVEGMPHERAFGIREKYSENVGTILVVYDDAQLVAAMADDKVDFIIPFHRSQWRKSQYAAMGLPKTTKDYTYQQNEKWLNPKAHTHEYRGKTVPTKCTNYMPNDYWDFSLSGKQNAEKYLEMCANDGKRPKFYKLLQNNGDGTYSLKADGSTDGYWKLLIDFKMYDNNGVGVPQQPVQPIFDMDNAMQMLDDYSGDPSRFPVAEGIVDEFVSQYKAEHPDRQYSERDYSTPSDEELLMNARVEDATSENMRQLLTEYQARGREVEKMEEKLSGLKEERNAWREKSKHGGKYAQGLIDSKNRDIAKLEKQIHKYRDILAGKANSPELNKLLKAEREKTEARVKEQKEQVFQNYKDRKNRTAIRNRIKNLHAEMSRDLLRPREGHFVPEKLIRPVVDLLDLVNTETNRAKSESAQARIAAINAAYDAIKKDERYSQFYDETVKDMLVELSGTLAGRSIYDLTTAELEDVYTVMKAMRTTIRNAIKADLIEKGKEIWEIGNEMRQELRAGRGAHALQLLEKYHMTMLSAKRAFNRFGGYQQSSAWNKVYRMLDDAQLKMLTLEMQGTRIFDRVLEGKENLEKVEKLTSYREDDLVDVGLKDETGKAVPIPRGMMLSLYMHLQNEENMRHLMYGGITLPDFKRYYKGRSEAWGQGTVSIPALGARVAALDELFSKGELSDAEYEEAYKEHKAEIDEIFDSIRKAIEEQLTDYDRQWIAACREFFDGFSRRELNRVTNEMYGFSKARVDNYFPIVTDSDFLKSEFESISKNISLENAGFMKERVRASNPIHLEDITKAVNRQISNVSRYAGLTQALKTFGNVYNVQDRGFTDSVKKAMAKTYGKNGQQYVENLITDMVGGRNTPGTIFDRVKGNYAQAVLAANLSVTIKQAASFPTAAATVGWGPLMKAMARGGKSNLPISRADSNLISIYSPLLWYRSKGAIDVEIGDIANGRDWTQKAKWLMGWIEKTDRATVGRLWYAAEYYVKDNYNLEKGTEEQIKNGESPFYRKVAEVFADIVEDTQPNYTILQRPDILRNPNKLVRAMVMFSTQRFQNGNILIDAIGEYRAMVRADKQNGTPQTKTARKAARQKLTRAISSQTVSAMVLSAMTLLAGAVMHRMNPWRDDDDELTFESIAEEYLNGFLSSLTGSFLAGSEVYEGLQAMLTGSKYYGNDVGGISTINELATSVIQFEQQAVKLIGDEDSTAKDWQNLAEKQLWKVGEYLSQMTGIPTANIKKIIDGGRNHIADIMNEEFFSFEAGVDRSTAVNARRYYKAWMAGDNAKVRDVLKEMRGSGKSEDSIKNAISKQAKTAYEEDNIDIDQYAELLDRSGYWDEEKLNGKVLDIVRDEYVAGARTEKETVDLLIRYNAKVENEDDAWKKVREWNAKKEHADEEDYSYSQYEAIDEAIDANKDIGALVKELTDHGVEENNVRKHVKERLVDNYIGGNVTESALRNQLSRYCGIVAKADVDKIVNDANCQKQFGVSYSELDEEYRAGNVSKADMKSALVRYGNMSSADADKKLRWYDLQKQNPDMDITEGVCNSWYDGSSKSRENGHESAKAAGMSIEAYLKAKATLDPIKDQNGNDTGEDEYIAALTKITWLTPRQKDALYYEKYKGTTKYSHKTW